MNTKGLARYYASLTPRERLPLLVAAWQRGDKVEAERLARLAPSGLFVVPNFRGTSEGMTQLALCHLLQLLESAAQMWRTESMLASVADCPTDAEQQAQRERLRRILGLWGYNFVVATEAWQRFAAELNLEAEALLQDLPPFATVQTAERSARLYAFSAAEATAVQGTEGAVPIRTVAGALAELHAVLASYEACWLNAPEVIEGAEDED